MRQPRGIGLFLLLRAHRLRVISERLSVPIEGAVIQRDDDTKKELPIADVVITASDGTRSAATRSDASGYFKLVLHKRVLSDQPIHVTFRHPRYEPLDITVQTGRLKTPDQLYVAAMVPLIPKIVVPAGPRSPARPSRPASLVSNIRVRYTHQYPHPDECRLRSQDFPGGQQGRCALRSPVTVFTRWQVEGDLCDDIARCRGRQYRSAI